VNCRETFRRIMNYESVDRLPVIVIEPYERVGVEKWRTQGLPQDKSPQEFLGMDVIQLVAPDFSPIPAYECRIISEDEDSYVVQEGMGAVVRRRKEAPDMYYGFIDHPIKSQRDWDDYKRRFDVQTPGRLPENLAEEIARWNASETPVNLMLYPFFFRLCFYLMGMERFMTAFYEVPDLVHDIFSTYGRFVLDLIRPLLPTVKFDMAAFAEDLAYKSGPHISPSIYEEFWLPYQQPIVDELKSHGVPVIAMYTAGDINPLIPLLMKKGFNCTYPLERASGMDPHLLREKYGPDLRVAGGFPKEALIAGPEAIDREIEYLMPLIAQGGYIPAVDDMVPPEVPFDHYVHYVEAIKAIRL
jgi:hypothetical protein